MKLSALLADLATVMPSLDFSITGLTADSRAVSAGDVFIAYPGLTVDGRDFVTAAVKQGAIAILAEPGRALSTTVPIVEVPNLSQHLGKIAARFYGHPARALTVIGVTGTNGKTSITQYIAGLLTQLDTPTGVLGTIGYGLYPNFSPSQLTTPDAIQLQANLAALKKQGAQVIAMEVSSHALDQNRVAGIEFDTAIFTNLSHDHLDYHGTMAAYARAKKKLFHWPRLRQAIVNLDDPIGREILSELSPSVQAVTYGLNQHADFQAKSIHASISGFTARLVTPLGEFALSLPMWGQFTLLNLLGALAALHANGVDLSRLIKAASNLRAISGRMQLLQAPNHPTVVIDYAHTPDALDKALQAARQHMAANGKLYCVFGCGGDRDQAKRPLMGKVAGDGADVVILTNDNPRTEDPLIIIQAIRAGFTNPNPSIHEIFDRQLAIEYALTQAQSPDVILIAGKGHETYQIIGRKRCEVLSDQAMVLVACPVYAR